MMLGLDQLFLLKSLIELSVIVELEEKMMFASFGKNTGQYPPKDMYAKNPKFSAVELESRHNAQDMGLKDWTTVTFLLDGKP